MEQHDNVGSTKQLENEGVNNPKNNEGNRIKNTEVKSILKHNSSLDSNRLSIRQINQNSNGEIIQNKLNG